MKIALLDNFRNLVANLGTDRDKQSHGEYSLSILTDAALNAIYRTSWMGRKLVDIPAKDATRRWRDWNADQDQIEALEATEKRLRLQQKTKKAMQFARLYGGAAIYFSIRNDDPAKELDLDRVQADSLDFLTVFDSKVLQAGDIEQDPMSEYYGKPQFYYVTAGANQMTRIHPSRLAIFTGAETLVDLGSSFSTNVWGDSVLQAAYEAVRNADAVASNSASLVYEAKIDVLQIPDLANIMADERKRTLLEERVALSAMLKSNNGMLVIDGEEEYSQKQFTFAGLPDITYQALQAVSGAADIPITRFLGQSPAGLSSTGESDLRNYYDAVNSMQALELTPILERLDEALIRSALGDRPDDVDYTWASLWQMSDEQKSAISKEVAETIKTLADSGLFFDDDLAEAAANLIVEHSILPTFEITEHAEEESEPDPIPPPVVVAPIEPSEEDDES